MAAGNIGGGTSLAAFGGGAAGTNQVIWTSDGSALLTDTDFRFDGTDIAMGGIIVDGTRLKLYQESGGNGINIEAAAANQAANIFTRASDNRIFGLQMYGGTSAGTVGGRNFAALAYLQAVNTAHMLIGPPDFSTWVHQGANLATSTGGVAKTFVTDAAHDGTGTDVFYTYSIPAASLLTDGARVDFEYAATFAANANNKTIIVAYGGTEVYNSGTVAKNGGSIRVFGSVLRTGAATQRWFLTVVDDASTVRFPVVSAYGTAAETLSGAVAIEFRGTAGAASDIVAKAGIVSVYPAGN